MACSAAVGQHCGHMTIPASMSARLPPHTEAIEDEPVDTEQRQSVSSGPPPQTLSAARDAPLDSSTSDVTRMVKGKSGGTTGLSAFSASAPEHTHTHTLRHETPLRLGGEGHERLTLTVTQLSPVDPSHLPDLIGGIRRKL